jgi:PAS domain S-box-containing protein
LGESIEFRTRNSQGKGASDTAALRPTRDQDPGLDFADFFENGAVALHLVGPDGIILHANKAELDLLGYTADEYIGRHIADFHADQDTISDILERLTRGEKLDKYPARLRASDGSLRHVEITSSVQFKRGKFINTRCFTVDVTEIHQAREQARRKDQQLREILDALPAAVYTTDAAGKITFYNRAAVELAGREPLIGKDEWCVTFRLYTPDGKLLPHDECPMAIALKEQRPVRGVEALLQRPDGTLVPFLPFPTPIGDANGALVGAVNMLVDITDRKRAEDQQALLIRELHHRVKNMLATIQAIMGSTARSSNTIQEFQDSFAGRIASLAKTHSALAEHALQNISFHDLLSNELDPYDDGSGKRIALNGPYHELESAIAIPLSMAVHELTTNAAKHGALSVLGGSVEVTWSVVEGREGALQFSWIEKHDPPVETPTRRGFGTQLLQRVLTQQIGADAELNYVTDGLQAHFRIPLPSAPSTPLDTLDGMRHPCP